MYTVRQLTADDIPLFLGHKAYESRIVNCDRGHGVIVYKDSTAIGAYTFYIALEEYDGDTHLVIMDQVFELFQEHKEQGHWETENAKQIIRAFRDWQFNSFGCDKVMCFVPTTKLKDYDEGHWESVEDLHEGEFINPDFTYKRCIATYESYKRVYGVEE
tara:strand:+ start:152 stop:628 length:477 start_codon:yes stop_codon:yes gene_type:complete